jgi:hypothetical protein
VNQYSTLDKLNPYYMQASNGMDVGGTTGGRNELLLDGAPIGVWSRGSYSPSMDAVQEVSIQQNSVDAEFGFSSGGVVSVGMKSGTNEYHGTASYFGRTPGFNALANRYTRTKNVVRQNDEGFTVGGPIRKNRLFTFFNYERLYKTEPREATATLPTDLERTGDFSRSLPVYGLQRTIYDPYTTVLDPTSNTATRLPFAGNVIPATRIDPSAKVVMNDIWKPNGPGDDLAGTNNFKMTYYYWTKYWNFSNRTDFYASDKLRMFTRYSTLRTRLDNDNYGGTAATPSGNCGLMDALNAVADVVYTFNPTSVLNARFGTTYVEDDYNSEWAKYGMDGLRKIWGSNEWYKSYVKDLDAIYYPFINIGNAGFGKSSTWFFHPRKYNASATFSKDRGKHYMKLGGAFRHSYGVAYNPAPISFTSAATTTASTYINANTKTSGDAYAGFLLGAISAGTAKYTAVRDIISDQYAIFFQDDYKLNRKITLNLGLRYEYETAPKERYDRMSRYLDLTNPIPEMQINPPSMPAEVTAIRTSKPIYNGAWIYADSDNRGLYKANKTIILPRIGVAYRARDNMAIRVGYARYALPMTNAIGPGYNLSSDGYSVTSTILGFLTGVPQTSFSDPFPAGVNPLTAPSGKSTGRYTNLGTDVTWWQQDAKLATHDRMNFTVQREVPFGVRVDATYFFAFTHHFQSSNIWGGTNSTDTRTNMVDPRLSYTYKSALDKTVANPFYNYMTAATFPGSMRNSPSVSIGSLLRPYPHYGTMTIANEDMYSNRYQALQLRAERTFANGFGITFGYNYNREATTGYYDDVDRYDGSLLWWGGTNPRHRVSAAGTFDFPIGRGRAVFGHMHPLVDLFVGGWATSHMVLWNSGSLLSFGGMNVTGDPRIDNPTADKWFDTSVFSLLTAYTRRSNPPYYSGLVGPGFWEWDASVVKYFPLAKVRENMKLEIRLDAYNVPNSFMNANPSTSVTSASFGKSVGPANGNLGRSLQYTARLHF